MKFVSSAFLLLVLPLNHTSICFAQQAEPQAKEILSKFLKEQNTNLLTKKALAIGNADRGKAVFHREALGCAKCHEPTGKDVPRIGPELSMIGDRLSAEQIVRSIIDPNETINEAFQSYIVATEEGEIVTGVMLRENKQEVVLANPDVGEIRIARDEIEEMQKTKSAMPDNVADELNSEQEFYDLISYLASQKASSMGTPVVAGDEIIVRDIPSKPGQPKMLAIARPDGICYTYVPHQCRLEKIWEGPLGWELENGSLILNESSAEPFHLRDQPWKIGVGKNSKQFDFKWLGHEINGNGVVMRYELKEKKEGKVWKVDETLEVDGALHQQLHFQIKHPQGTNEVLTYWLWQTKFRNVKTNGQQAQRNQLEFLKPGQTDYTISLSRRRSGLTMPNGYSIKRIDGPKPEKPYLFEPASFSFAPDGTGYVSTRTGSVWRHREGKWNLFADGLHESLGVCATDGNVYAMQKPELTKLEDTDGDGSADLYRTVADRFRFTGQYHEFAFGPVLNSSGELFFSLGLSAHGFHEVKKTETGQMGSPLGYRGWMMKVDAEGKLGPFASGLRSPAGIGINANDDIFITDNQGDWVGSSYLGHAEEGDFLGHPASLWDNQEHGLTPRRLNHKTVDQRFENVPKLDEEKFTAQRKRPAVWLVHGDLSNSPGNPSFCPPTGFGPFEGQAFVADISHRTIIRCPLEKVNGQYQGAAIPFIRPMGSAAYSTAFDREGNLWVGSVGRGWTTGDPIIEVVSFDPANLPFEMQRIELTKFGFDIHFTRPIGDSAITKDQISIKSFHYLYWAEYGSDRQDYSPVAIEGLKLSQDRRTLSIELPLIKDKVYEIDLGQIISASGLELKNNYAFYTLNELR